MLFPLLGTAQEGKELFRSNCASCHTVGGGKRVGPDLAGVTERREKEWLYDFIKSSTSMIESGDSLAKSLYQEFNKTKMPDQDLSDEEIGSVLSYVKANSPGEEASEKATAEAEKKKEKEEESKPAPKGKIEKGVKLFAGYQSFENGGPSCASCHHVKNDRILVGGGRYAKDLTRAHHRLGSAGIKGMLESPGFPEMKESYDDAPLTDQEIAHLVAFLKEAEEERLYQSGMDMSGGFLFWGAVIGVPLFLLLIAMIWVRRQKKPVEHKIFQRKGYGAPLKGKAS
jgi:mono/diheme cytochrome c family protein